MKGYNNLRKKTLEILNSQLPKQLYYHDVNHTLDVLKQCNNYIEREKIDHHNAKLLRLGALLHDIGFTVSNENHEERGKMIAEKMMNTYGFPKKDIDIVKGLITATRIPQLPKNELEKIICDFGFGFLGRSDFYPISNHLFEELKFNSQIKTKLEWNNIQIKFMQTHKYHTQFALKNRQSHKEKRINELILLVAKSGK